MTDVYFFATNTQNTLVSYPYDQTHEFFQYAISKSKNNAQIVLVRKDNLLHYCYVRKIWNKKIFGLCLRIDRIYSDVKDLFRAFDSVFAKLVDAGVILQMDDKSNVKLNVSNFATETVAIKEMSDILIHVLGNIQKNTLPLPPVDYSISINDCIELSLEDSTTVQIIKATKKYSNVYIVKTHAEIARVTEIANLIKNKNKEILQLQETIVQQDDTISNLKKQKNKYKWVISLLFIIFFGSIVFFIHNYNQNIAIGKLNVNVDNLNDSLKSTSKRLEDTTYVLLSTQKELSEANKTIVNLKAINKLKTDSLRKLEKDLINKEKLVEEKDKNIADLKAQLPQKYRTKYKEQYIYNKCGGKYSQSDCLFPLKGIEVIIYLKEDGYGLTNYGGWIPLKYLEKVN